jgi:hypothetical protein
MYQMLRRPHEDEEMLRSEKLPALRQYKQLVSTRGADTLLAAGITQADGAMYLSAEGTTLVPVPLQDSSIGPEQLKITETDRHITLIHLSHVQSIRDALHRLSERHVCYITRVINSKTTVQGRKRRTKQQGTCPALEQLDGCLSHVVPWTLDWRWQPQNAALFTPPFKHLSSVLTSSIEKNEAWPPAQDCEMIFKNETQEINNLILGLEAAHPCK